MDKSIAAILVSAMATPFLQMITILLKVVHTAMMLYGAAYYWIGN